MKQLTPIELQQYLVSNKPLIIDVREEWEWEICHLDNSVSLPMCQFMQDADDMDKSKEMVIVCHHGMRSMEAADYLQSIGFKNIINLIGGVDAWANQVDNSMDRY